MNDSLHIARRMQDIQAFHVMDVLARARTLESKGRSIVHMEIGEPDFVTPKPIIDAGVRALEQGYTHYTPALGLSALRELIAAQYKKHYGIEIPAQRVIVTPGASGALQLVLGVLINPGDQVLMADPGYPCNRHFVRLFEGKAASIPVDATTDYQLTASLIEDNWTVDTMAVMLASPSNPTGTLIKDKELGDIVSVVEQHHGTLIVDEIYHGLVYGDHIKTALATTQDCFVINSFSKYYGMTGWRIGWMLIPEEYIDPIDKLAQNIFLAPSTPAQYAALAAFNPETTAILEERYDQFKARRDYLLPALREIGFEIPVIPQGAFYLYAGCTKFTSDSYQFTMDLLENAGVAITPGCDFGSHRADQHVRFAYTTSIENLEKGVKRLKNYL